MPSWKKILLKCAGFGAGFALALVAIGGLLWWWSVRPRAPRPWNKTAIVAKYEELALTTGDPVNVTFTYSLKNDTDQDYVVGTKSVHLMVRDFSNTLEPREGSWVPVDVMVPAHHAVKYSFSLTDVLYSPDRKRMSETEIIEHVGQKLSKMNGFVLFDDEKRYEIELPTGWKDIDAIDAKKQPLGTVNKGAQPQAVDCYDKQGKRIHNIYDDLAEKEGGITTSCPPGQIQVPRGLVLEKQP